ncbi:LysE family transporter [Salinimonas lutimaris]|uniref:LysE family transporter n=1 Tax=Salinimonas lutimaris TaxID=914153 RepID=UPI001E3F7785|nr:LysE family transporter [Salinimonas lutimaris]
MLNGNNQLPASMQVSPEQANGNEFVQGIVVSVLSPKVALFFLSILPQFVNPQGGAATQQL